MEELMNRILAEAPGNGESSTMSAESSADVINAQTGSLPDYDCEKCRNKGFIAYTKGGALLTRECSCMPVRRSVRRIRRSGLSGLLERYTFGSYETPEEWQRQAKELAMRFCDERGKWLCVSGTPGTGKTHLCTAVCGELLNAGRSVRYFRWRNELPALKALQFDDRGRYFDELRGMKEADVLYIDDFFKGRPTEADLALAFELLDARYAARSTTILSSELSVEAMLDLDEALGSRIYERSKGFCICCPRRNWRLRA